MSQIGDLILNTRKKLGITQSELAAKSEVGQSTISYIEKGQTMPIFDVLERIIVKGFNISINDFFSLYESDSTSSDISMQSLIPTKVESLNELDTLGEKLFYLRNYEKMNQTTVANYLGITKAGYSRYECNIGKPPMESLIKLSNFFNVPLKLLLTDDSNRVIDISTLSDEDAEFVISLVNRIKGLQTIE